MTSDPATLDEIEKLLDAGASVARLFGADVVQGLRRLELICHPDRHPGDVARATRVFQRLQALASRPIPTPTKLKSPKRTYTLTEQLAVGDVADLHRATWDGSAYIAKISRTRGADKLLDVERHAVTTLLSAAGDSSFRHYYPLLVESFPAHSRRVPKRVNVFSAGPPLHSAEQLLTRYPAGLDGRHIVWMAKRLFTAIGFVHRQSLVHGAVLPPHLLFNLENHGLVLCGWGQSVETGHVLQAAVTKYRDLYPPEALAKKPATSETDVFMASQTLLKLADPDKLPRGIAAILRACSLPGQRMRPSDAFTLHDDMTDAADRYYGPPKFVPLHF